MQWMFKTIRLHKKKVSIKMCETDSSDPQNTKQKKCYAGTKKGKWKFNQGYQVALISNLQGAIKRAAFFFLSDGWNFWLFRDAPLESPSLNF